MRYLKLFENFIGKVDIESITKDILIDLNEQFNDRFEWKVSNSGDEHAMRFDNHYECGTLTIKCFYQTGPPPGSGVDGYKPDESLKGWEVILERLFKVYISEGLIVYDAIESTSMVSGRINPHWSTFVDRNPYNFELIASGWKKEFIICYEN